MDHSDIELAGRRRTPPAVKDYFKQIYLLEKASQGEGEEEGAG